MLEKMETNIEEDWKPFLQFAGISAIVQFLCIFIPLIITIIIGYNQFEITSSDKVLDLFTGLKNDRAITFLIKMDPFSVLNVLLFTVIGFGFFGVLKSRNGPLSLFALISVLIGVTIASSTSSIVSIVHLADRYAVAATETERVALLTAGEAVIASGWWTSTAGFISAFPLQGSILLFSILMLKSNYFSNSTAYFGFISNGSDLLRHVVKIPFPSLGDILMVVMLSYIVWYLLVARDFLRLSKTMNSSKEKPLEFKPDLQ